MTNNEHENKKQQKAVQQAEPKSSKKAINLIVLLILGCTLLGAGLIVLGNDITIFLGVFVLIFDVLIAIILPISYSRARNMKLCKKCKTQYDYDNDIAYNEVSRYTKTRNVTDSKNSDPSKLITEQYFIVYNVDCQCHNCGERRSYQKKVVAGEAHYDGSVKYNDPKQTMEQFYSNSFLGTKGQQKLIKLASIALGIIGIILIIVGLI